MVIAGQRVPRFQTMRTAALLGYLALNSDRSHSRESLAELLWPEGDPIAIRNRLNQAVSSLRRQIEPPGVVPESILRSDRLAIRLMPETFDLDVDEFRTLTRTVLTTDQPAEAIVAGEAAIALYRGDLMDGLYDDWLMPDRLALEDAYVQTVVRLTRAYAGLSKYDEAIRTASRLSLKDAADESVHQLLMQMYVKAGRPSAALRQYRELKRVLDQTGQVPSVFTEKILERAKASRTEAESEETTFTQPATIANQPAQPPLGTSPKPPVALTPFFGRESDLQTLSSMLAGEGRLVTVTGIGGTGKTRLVQRYATDKAEPIWIQMADIETTVAEEITRQWLIQASDHDDPATLISQRLGHMAEPLLILDNCDHVLDEDRSLVVDLLGRHLGLKVLVTARLPMGIDGELVLPLGPLQVPEPDEPLSLPALAQNPSVALFVSRAQANRPDFQLTERNAETICELCRRLEGIPLAIELAASWARTMTPQQMLDRMSARFTLLESRRQDTALRHRTMRTVLESSVSELTGHCREILEAVSICDGGASAEVINLVAEHESVSADLAMLVESGLVVPDHQDDNVVRFGVLDTVREYILCELPVDRDVHLKTRHLEAFSRHAETKFEEYQHGQPGEHIAWIGHEIGNLTSALGFAIRQGSVVAVPLSLALTPFWEHRNQLRDGLDWLARAESVASSAQGVDLRVETGRLMWLAGDYKSAMERFESVASNEEANDVARGRAWLGLGREWHRRGDFEAESKCLATAEDLLALSPRVEDRCRLAIAKGHLFIETDQMENAKSAYESALRQGRAAGNAIWTGSALLSLGHLSLVRDQNQSARELLYAALDAIEQSSSLTLLCVIMPILAKLERRTRHLSRAWGWLMRLSTDAPERADLMLECLREATILLAADGRIAAAAWLSGLVESRAKEAKAKENRQHDDYRAAVLSASMAHGEVWSEMSEAGRLATIEQGLIRMRRWAAENPADFVDV